MKIFRIIFLASGHELADALVRGSEAGLLHLRAICQIVKRKIRVWDRNGDILTIIDDAKTKESIGNDKSHYIDHEEENSVSSALNDIDEHTRSLVGLKNSLNGRCTDCFNFDEQYPRFKGDAEETILREKYLELEYHVPDNGKPGHWIKKDGLDDEVHGNNCLFYAICQQCPEYEPCKLRLLTADVIRSQQLVVEEGFPQFDDLAGCLLMGGAKYEGNSPEDAKIILNNSQGTRGHGHAAKAHPRGHASQPGENGDINSVENYSRNSSRDFPKSGWLSRQDQDYAMHQLLLTRDCQQAMRELNQGGTRVVVKMAPGFEIKMGLWAGGEMFSGPIIAEFVTIILQHHNDKSSEPNEDVQVFTCYPIAPAGNRQRYSTSTATNKGKRSICPWEDNDTENSPRKKFKRNE